VTAKIHPDENEFLVKQWSSYCNT